MTGALLAGSVVGIGLLCIARGLFTPRPSLVGALARLGAPNRGATGQPSQDVEQSYAFRLGSWIMRLFGADMGSLRSDLLVVERSEEVHLAERIRTSVFLSLAPPMFAIVIPLLAGVSPFANPTLVLVSSMVAAVAGWFLTDAQIRQRAARRRAEFDSSLVTYLGLVSIATAGGSGINEALWSAVDQGVGWPFQILRRSLADARNRGVSPWEGMEVYAERLELTSLAELAATMKLGGTSGAFVRDSVMTKSRSLREHQLADIEQEANSRTSAMAGPTGLMLGGFVILLLYPAIVAILSL